MVYTAHPLFAERARAALGDDGARRLRTELVTLLSQHPSDHLSDRLRLASLALDSDAPQPVAEVVAAAQQALRLGDLTLGERLARSALERSGGLAARLALANALAWQGRGREADAVLAEVDAAALSEPELMAWTLLRAANQFWMLSEPERATAFLQTIRNRVPDAGRAHHPGRAERHLRDERRQRRARHRDRPRGAGVTVGRRPGGGLGGQRGHAVLRRGRAASTKSSRWRSARWPPSIPGCCASRSGWARPPRC